MGVCLIILLGVTSAVAQQNPFLTPKKSSPETHQQVKKAPPHPIYIQLAIWQKQLSDTMAELMDQARTEKKVGPLMRILAIGFFYGVVHAAGPGHGKAVTVSYMVSQKPSLVQSLLLGNVVALVHGMSGILLVLCVHMVIQSGMMGPLQSTTRITQYISYSLITLLGVVLVVKSLVGIRSKAPQHNTDTDKVVSQKIAQTLPVAIAVGMVPCPGVVMVMLLAMSMNLITLGVALGISIAVGMAFTITLIVMGFMYLKKIAIRSLASRPRTTKWFITSLEISAGMVVAVLGGLLLYGA